LDDVKAYNTNKDSLLYKDTLNISVNYNKSIDVEKPYIHYIAFKVMNNVSRKSWTDILTSLACLIMICSL
jgi:hypothetical protein